MTGPTSPHRYSIVRVRGASMDLDTFSRASGVHPDLVRRLVALGLLDATSGPGGELRFAPSQLAVLGRIQRLRAGFALNYAAVGLVMDLLDRIAELEAAQRKRSRRTGGRSWT